MLSAKLLNKIGHMLSMYPWVGKLSAELLLSWRSFLLSFSFNRLF
jgi:hypothetical protein